MVRKGGATAEFVYGLGISSLQPTEQVDNNEETPLRFVSVQLQLANSSKNLDVDIHAFLFEADGTYVDCVFYKNPTLAGKSVRLLQEDQELLVDLRYIPQRCSFIVCTLAIYSGGTVAQLGDGSVQLGALVPRVGLEENANFPHLPCGQIPPSSSEFYEWVCLGMLPLRPRSSLGEECGMMLCLLAHHAGFWYFKPVLKPVTAFTPQGLIEPAQDYVTKQVAGLNEEKPGMELGSLIKAARAGAHVQFELADTEECLTEPADGLNTFRTPETGTLQGVGPKTGSAIGSNLGNDQPEIYTGGSSGGDTSRDNLRLFTRDEGKRTWEGAEIQAGQFSQDETKGHMLLAQGQGDVAVGKTKTTSKQIAPTLQTTADSSRGKIPHHVQERSRLLDNETPGNIRDFENNQFRNKDAQPLDMEQSANNRGGRRVKAQEKEIRGVPRGQEYSGGVVKVQKDGRVLYTDASVDAVSDEAKGIERPANRFYRIPGSDNKLTGDRVVDGVSSLVSYPPVDGHGEAPNHGVHVSDGRDMAGRQDLWRESVERRLSALERSVESIECNLQRIAAATSEMQKNNNLYLQELRERFTELKSDVASDIESALSGPLEALSLRVEEVKDGGGADAKQLAEQRQKIWAVDRMVLFLERNWHILAQSISELRFQISGLEQRIEYAVPAFREATLPPTDHAKGLPLSLQSSTCVKSVGDHHDGEVLEAVRVTQNNETTAQQIQGQSSFAFKALEELSRIQIHVEAFGACMRRLASATAPDGLKGLNPVERRVLSFAGTPKVFAALQDLERALETINLCGPGTPGAMLY